MSVGSRIAPRGCLRLRRLTGGARRASLGRRGLCDQRLSLAELDVPVRLREADRPPVGTGPPQPHLGGPDAEGARQEAGDVAAMGDSRQSGEAPFSTTSSSSFCVSTRAACAATVLTMTLAVRWRRANAAPTRLQRGRRILAATQFHPDSESEAHDMTKLIRTDRLLVLAALAVLAVWPLAQVAHAGPPGTHRAPARSSLRRATRCSSSGMRSASRSTRARPATGFAWGLVAPRADLYDDNGKLVATHFGGPTWQAKDGSIGRGASARRPGHRRPDRHPLAAADGRLEEPRPGGDAPTRPSSSGSHHRRPRPGGGALQRDRRHLAEVPYTADYYFWKKTGS